MVTLKFLSGTPPPFPRYLAWCLFFFKNLSCPWAKSSVRPPVQFDSLEPMLAPFCGDDIRGCHFSKLGLILFIMYVICYLIESILEASFRILNKKLNFISPVFACYFNCWQPTDDNCLSLYLSFWQKVGEKINIF